MAAKAGNDKQQCLVGVSEQIGVENQHERSVDNREWPQTAKDDERREQAMNSYNQAHSAL